MDCAEYFRSQEGYRRCFEELLKKWKSYGRPAGVIVLEHTSEEERRLLYVGMTRARKELSLFCVGERHEKKLEPS